MHPQLELLLQIQDLKSQRRELAEAGVGAEMEQQEFGVDLDQALAQLDEKIAEVKGGLEPRIRKRLDKMTASHGRAVAPLIGGTCYGCFTNVPTASIVGLSNREQIQYCENCGRFLYSLD